MLYKHRTNLPITNTRNGQIATEGVQRWSHIGATFSMLIAILLLSGDPVWDGGYMWTPLNPWMLLLACTVNILGHREERSADTDTCYKSLNPTPFLSFLLFSKKEHFISAPPLLPELVLNSCVLYNYINKLISQTYSMWWMMFIWMLCETYSTCTILNYFFIERFFFIFSEYTWIHRAWHCLNNIAHFKLRLPLCSVCNRSTISLQGWLMPLKGHQTLLKPNCTHA